MLRTCVGHPIFSALFAGFLHGIEYSSEIYLVFSPYMSFLNQRG